MAAAAARGAKRSLRAELKQRLQAMSAEERLRQSRLLTEKVIAHSQYQKSRRVSIFLSMQDEVETEEIIKDIFRQGKTCFIPRYQFQSNHMDMVKLASAAEISSLPKTSWNIAQPGEDEVREEALSTAHPWQMPDPDAFRIPSPFLGPACQPHSAKPARSQADSRLGSLWVGPAPTWAPCPGALVVSIRSSPVPSQVGPEARQPPPSAWPAVCICPPPESREDTLLSGETVPILHSKVTRARNSDICEWRNAIKEAG
ncbi:5-formyltetrahydrofolate cyclo-ligase isoform X1 [Manis javanica]|uniref:5-formyltetrahydrofolate cyclo-ligase isoform X1 n=1 Tax=Manis javanica TaxID=9974 RepID=UPI003C6CD14E